MSVKSCAKNYTDLKNRVRIIAGSWKRHYINIIPTEGLRPSLDSRRETLFNWLGQNLNGQSCLDMFAGSGALGFEAASRGAAYVLMLEVQAKVAQQLRFNYQKLTIKGNNCCKIDIIHTNAITYIERFINKSFDLIFLDPPFALNSNSYKNNTLLIEALYKTKQLLKPGGFIYAESPIALEIQLIKSLNLNHYKRGKGVHYYLLSYLSI